MIFTVDFSIELLIRFLKTYHANHKDVHILCMYVHKYLLYPRILKKKNEKKKRVKITRMIHCKINCTNDHNIGMGKSLTIGYNQRQTGKRSCTLTYRNSVRSGSDIWLGMDKEEEQRYKELELQYRNRVRVSVREFQANESLAYPFTYAYMYVHIHTVCTYCTYCMYVYILYTYVCMYSINPHVFQAMEKPCEREERTSEKEQFRHACRTPVAKCFTS